VRRQLNDVRTRLGTSLPINFDLRGESKDQERSMSPAEKGAMESALQEREQSLRKNKALNDAFVGGMEALKAQKYDDAGKKFTEAQAELTKAAQMDPPNAGRCYHNLGALLANNHQLEFAGEAFRKAIEADPNYADAYYQYGIYLISKAKTRPTVRSLHQRERKKRLRGIYN
jgi:tetratricopeptide (TPR) repeat protein